MKKVAYILVCWNNKTILEECLDSIDRQTYGTKSIYLIDNGSEDGSADFVSEKYPNVNLIRSKSNNGFAKGNNIAIREALKDREVQYLALINTDARLKPDWTEKLVAVADSGENVAALQGLTLDYYDHAKIDSHHLYIATNLQATQYGYNQQVSSVNLYTCQVQGVNAAAAIFTRAFIESQPHHELFDESLFMYLEDVDVALRAQITGWKNYFVANAYAYHMGSASSKKQSSSFSLYYTARNQPAILIKSMPFKILMRSLKPFLVNEYHLIMHLKNNYESSVVKNFLKGRLVGYPRALLYIPKRRKIMAKKKIDNDYLWLLIQGKGFLR